MKRVLPIFLMLLCLFSCSNDDDVETSSYSDAEKEMLSSLQGTWVCEDEIFDTGVIAQTYTLTFAPFSAPQSIPNADGAELTFDGQMGYEYTYGPDGNVLNEADYFFEIDAETKSIKAWLKNEDSYTWSVVLSKDITHVVFEGNIMSCYLDGKPMDFIKR